MPTQRFDLNDLRLLMQVVEHGGFAKAAHVVGVPKSTISQRIAGLENALGTGLLRRSPRALSLTEVGARLIPHARAIDALARGVERSLIDDAKGLRGCLRLAANAELAHSALADLISRFLDQHSDITIKIEVTNRSVDLVSEGFDLLVREHQTPLPDSSLRQRVVARFGWLLVASPDWIKHHGSPSCPSEIATSDLLGYATVGAGCLQWSMSRGDDQRTMVPEARFSANDHMMLKRSAINGSGVALMPDYLAHEDIWVGRLVHVLPDWVCPTSSVSVLSPPRAQSSKLATAFSDFLAKKLPSALT